MIGRVCWLVGSRTVRDVRCGLSKRTSPIFMRFVTDVEHPERRLQSKRLAYQLRRFDDHITDALVCLHALDARAGASSVQDYWCYDVLSLAQTRDAILSRVADLLACRRALRSAYTNRLVVPPVRMSTVAYRAFPVVGP